MRSLGQSLAECLADACAANVHLRRGAASTDGECSIDNAAKRVSIDQIIAYRNFHQAKRAVTRQPRRRRLADVLTHTPTGFQETGDGALGAVADTGEATVAPSGE